MTESLGRTSLNSGINEMEQSIEQQTRTPSSLTRQNDPIEETSAAPTCQGVDKKAHQITNKPRTGTRHNEGFIRGSPLRPQVEGWPYQYRKAESRYSPYARHGRTMSRDAKDEDIPSSDGDASRASSNDDWNSRTSHRFASLAVSPKIRHPSVRVSTEGMFWNTGTVSDHENREKAPAIVGHDHHQDSPELNFQRLTDGRWILPNKHLASLQQSLYGRSVTNLIRRSVTTRTIGSEPSSIHPKTRDKSTLPSGNNPLLSSIGEGSRSIRYQNLSSTFSATEHYTISQDHTSGEEARRSHLLADFGKRCEGNGGIKALLSQPTVPSRPITRISDEMWGLYKPFLCDLYQKHVEYCYGCDGE